MSKGKTIRLMLIVSALLLLGFLILQPFTIMQYKESIAVLFPAGVIALEQRNLLFIIQAIMLLVMLPVFAFTYIFSWKYNAQNPRSKTTYDPDLVDNTLAEYVWWGIPIVLTTIIAILTWQKTYQLDPYKPLQPIDKQKTIQVVALQWKWLFIYPEENIATVNFVQFPEKIPIRFEITADAPMNSFWIPHLGGQIYAMPAMRTELNLIADVTGEFRGSSANLSGEGFAGMHFIAKASSEEEYQKWVATAQQSSSRLDQETYQKLAAPSANVPPETFQLQDKALFNQIIMKYMHPQEVK